jgi:hypothetical protein
MWMILHPLRAAPATAATVIRTALHHLAASAIAACLPVGPAAGPGGLRRRLRTIAAVRALTATAAIASHSLMTGAMAAALVYPLRLTAPAAAAAVPLSKA